MSSIQDSSVIKSVSVLLPAWEVLVIISPESTAPLTTSISGNDFLCFYPNNQTSPARFSGVLASTNQTTFKCVLPMRNRRQLPFLSPVLIRSGGKEFPVSSPPPEPMLRWSRLAYESFSTENDVVLLVKGVNNRQGINRSPHEFSCVFIDEVNNNTVKTAVTSSIQEVFRCERPDLTPFGYGGEDNELNKLIKITLEIRVERGSFMVASVAYYIPWRKLANERPKLQLCASTMVYNVAKFLREWVMYHSKIGVEKFVLYDNDSDDDLMRVIKELNQEGYNIETFFWIWPKTQEAGFSHASLYAKDSCTWMMYLDVDEFVFATSWVDAVPPPADDQTLKSILPKTSSSSLSNRRLIGQVSIRCNEFGPSNLKSHPSEGVTQGYTCRRKVDNRHKSIVLLDAIDHSVHNAIHHFKLKAKYRTKAVSLEVAVVNHYKYQAWSEFKAKFRRRVSAYVVDWTQTLNPSSQDRTPGLGFQAIEPAGWENMFCEVEDNRLKLLTQRWFKKQTTTGTKMAWQL
ncbi:unnamed protein product [Dovyalis caffra]|uniref:Glycosyltransferase family 92 protein n=1 Tax=Dovyalis caffra TaxID=77055 RepID=A0AAV1S564_9ROSI|nr:unnamed protein product [Dovyalis caffra]